MNKKEEDLQRSNNLYDAITDLPDTLVNKIGNVDNAKIKQSEEKDKQLEDNVVLISKATDKNKKIFSVIAACIIFALVSVSFITIVRKNSNNNKNITTASTELPNSTLQQAVDLDNNYEKSIISGIYNKYGENYLIYRGKNIDLKVKYVYNIGETNKYKNIEVDTKVCLAINGTLQKFSIDDDEEDYLHNMKVTTGNEFEFNISVMPKLSQEPEKQSNGEVYLIIIPNLLGNSLIKNDCKNIYLNIDSINLNYLESEIVFESVPTILDSNNKGKYVDIKTEDAYKKYGKEKLLRNPFFNEEYIAFDENGSCYLLSSEKKGTFFSYVFVNDKLVNAFDGSNCYEWTHDQGGWSMNDDGSVNYTIDGDSKDILVERKIDDTVINKGDSVFSLTLSSEKNIYTSSFVENSDVYICE